MHHARGGADGNASDGTGTGHVAEDELDVAALGRPQRAELHADTARWCALHLQEARVPGSSALASGFNAPGWRVRAGEGVVFDDTIEPSWVSDAVKPLVPQLYELKPRSQRFEKFPAWSIPTVDVMFRDSRAHIWHPRQAVVCITVAQ